MNKDRLNKLADFLITVPPERFDMSHWLSINDFDQSTLECGTAACAGGWACSIPEFRKAGLKLIKSNLVCVQAYGCEWIPEYEGYFADDAMRKFFDLDKMQTDSIFMPGGYDRPPTPAEVAAKIRAVVAASGS